jgi:hypothetical protein
MEFQMKILNTIAAFALLSGAAFAGEYSQGSSSTYMRDTGGYSDNGYVEQKNGRTFVESNPLAVEPSSGAPSMLERQLRRQEERGEGSVR